MDVAVVIGIALELAGAVLLASDALTSDPGTLASRGNLYPMSGVPRRESQFEPARSVAGFALLAAGFAVQISAYAVTEGSYLLAVASGVLIGGFVAGRVAADQLVARWLYRRAMKHHEAMSSS